MAPPPNPRRGLCKTCESPPASAEPVPAVIVYDDVASAGRALHLLSDLADDLCGEIDFQPQLWRLELLEHPTCQPQASADLAAARIILLATAQPELPPSVEELITGSLDQRAPDMVALVMVPPLDRQADDFSGSHNGQLRRRAQENGSAFFVSKPSAMSTAAQLMQPAG